jgi:hypothetical protein
MRLSSLSDDCHRETHTQRHNSSPSSCPYPRL